MASVDMLIASHTELKGAPLTGTRRLMLAVLENGIHTYLTGTGPEWSEAEHWVLSTGRDSPFSFTVLCEQFSLDAVAVRLMLVQLRDAPERRAKFRARPQVRRMRRLSMHDRGPRFSKRAKRRSKGA
jgi:hypothetical protein